MVIDQKESLVKPEISVIICTYRNPLLLRECLISVLEQDIPSTQFEVLVVDNNSQDTTQAVVDDLCKQHPNMHYLLEHSQGLSFARNKGIRESSGEIVVFTDDDAIVEKNWITNLTKCFKLSNDIWAVGGKTLPLWRTTRPEWITDDMLVSLSIRDYGEEPRYLEWPERIIGVNCAFRKYIFQKTGYFDEQLGRKGDTLYDQEDIEIQRIIHQLGKKIFYGPDAVAWHVITEHRTSIEYFNKRTDGHIRTCCIIDFKQNRVKFLKKAISHLGRFPFSALNWWKDKTSPKAQKEYLEHKGYIIQAVKLMTSFHVNND